MEEKPNINKYKRLEDRNRKKVNKQSIEALKVTTEKKKQCNAKALEVVTNFSEGSICEDTLIKNLQYINQEHYQDIVEERAINKWCGYPPCSGRLNNIPTKQYHISTTHNKVFDITDRKNFCSNLCYKASKCLKEQIHTSPIWLREENLSSNYMLISLQSKGGIAGDEVDLGVSPLKVDDGFISESSICSDSENFALKKCEAKHINDTNNCDNSTVHFEEEHLTPSSVKINRLSDQCESGFSADILKKDEVPQISSGGTKNSMSYSLQTEVLYTIDSGIKANQEIKVNIDDKTCTRTSINDSLINQTDSLSGPEIIKEVETLDNSCEVNFNNFENVPTEDIHSEKLLEDNLEEKIDDHSYGQKHETLSCNSEKIIKKINPRKFINKKKLKDKRNEKSVTPMDMVIQKIEQILKEWLTIDSLCLLLGEDKVKDFLSERGKHIAELQQVNTTNDPHFYERYLAICKKLNILELEDTKQDIVFRNEVKKPLPNYDVLKEEAKTLDVKVKMFYKGDKVVQFEEPVGQNPLNETGEFVREPIVPLVDLHAQKALRRRIVWDKLRKVLQDLQKSLGLRGFNILDEAQALVNSFTLSSHNITMRPAEWNLIGITIIKLLSLMDKPLDQALISNSSRKHLTLLLMSYSLDFGYLDRLMVWLTDIENILHKEG